VIATPLPLAIAGFALAGFTGQLVGKTWITAATVAAVGGGRALLRHRLHPARA
jgi:hypothetical protein